MTQHRHMSHHQIVNHQKSLEFHLWVCPSHIYFHVRLEVYPPMQLAHPK